MTGWQNPYILMDKTLQFNFFFLVPFFIMIFLVIVLLSLMVMITTGLKKDVFLEGKAKKKEFIMKGDKYKRIMFVWQKFPQIIFLIFFIMWSQNSTLMTLIIVIESSVFLESSCFSSLLTFVYIFDRNVPEDDIFFWFLPCSSEFKCKNWYYYHISQRGYRKWPSFWYWYDLNYN